MTTTPQKTTLTISGNTSPEELSQTAITLAARQLAALDDDQVYALAHVALSFHILTAIQHKLDPKNPVFNVHHKHSAELMAAAQLPTEPITIIINTK